MSGRNRYFEVKSQYSNLRAAFEKRSSEKVEHFSMGSTKPSEPCIFLSHRSTDKAAVVEIGKYIMGKGIDVYLDANDKNLQAAVAANDHRAITAAIELGIAHSTDLLAYLTLNTASSHWVPYEIGFAKREGHHLAAIKSKDLAMLPSYLEIVQRITGIESLNTYLKEVIQRQTTSSRDQQIVKLARAVSIMMEGSGPTHSLTPYLAQK